MPKITREKFKTKHNVFDEFTNRNVYILISRGHFDGLIGPISTGKESNVFAAQKGDEKVVAKIYRLEAADFNRMYEYIAGDPRFQKIRKSRRHVIFAWCRREFKNLLKAREIGVEAPLPIAFFNNVLVMGFIGDKEAAPKLKDAFPEDVSRFFKKMIKYIEKLAKEGYVHGDLSAFNVLNYNDEPVFIDFSHATNEKNPRFLEFLRRDVKNVCVYFKKMGVEVDEKKVLKRVVGKAKVEE